VGNLDTAADDVVDHRAALIGDPETDDDLFTVSDITVSRKAVVARRKTGFLALRFDLIAGEVAEVGLTVGDQLVDRGYVAFAALGLEERTLIPIETKPGKRLGDGVDELLGRLRSVGVFDSQNELATHAAGKEPIEQCTSGTTDMEVAGGGRSESNAGRSHKQEAIGRY
jgi:hypothetical protein